MSRRPIDFFEDDDHAGVWTIRRHSRWQRLPLIVKLIVAVLGFELVAIVAFIAWLVIGAAMMPHP